MEISKEYHRIKEVGEEKPKGGELAAYGGIDEIKALLQGNYGAGGVDPKAVEDAGVAYVDAGGLLAESYIDIENLAVELAKHWKGKDSVEPQKALQLLHATTRELANRANHIGRPLEWFGRDILPWYKENPVDHGVFSFDDDINLLAPNKKAREHLDALNARMGELYDLLPEGVEKQLPKIDASGLILNDGPPPPITPSSSNLPKGLTGSGFDGLPGNNGGFGGTDLAGGGPSVDSPDLTDGGSSVNPELPGYQDGPGGAGEQGSNPGLQVPPGAGDVDFPATDVPGHNGAGVNGPDLGGMPDSSTLGGLGRGNGPNLDGSDLTSLAGYQPPDGYQPFGAYQPSGNPSFPGNGAQDFEGTRTPGGNGTSNSPSAMSTGPGAAGSFANAGGAASAANASTANASAARANGLPGGMPFLPGGMGHPGGGGEGREDGTASNWLKEEDDVWGDGEGYVQVDHQGRLG